MKPAACPAFVVNIDCASPKLTRSDSTYKSGNSVQTSGATSNDTGVTIGQYLLHRMECGLPIKLKIQELDGQTKKTKDAESNAPRNFYALRKMVEHEFDTIWTVQAQHHAILNDSHEGKLIRDYFHEALFYQRPLKSAADLVAQCSLEPTLPRAPRAQMAFQRFRIEKTLADLRWGVGRRFAMWYLLLRQHQHLQLAQATLRPRFLWGNWPRP